MKLKKIASMFLISALFLTGCQSSTSGKEKAEKEVKPEVKKEISVVAGSVSSSQVLEKLDANVIGVPTTQMQLPEKYKELPQVGMSMSPDFEIVASLEPDLFILDKMFEENVKDSMKEFDINTFFFDTSTYTSFITSIEELGKEINREEEAKNLINELKKSEEEATANKKDEGPTVAIIFGGGENFMLATETSYLGDIVKTIGGRNITSELNTDLSSSYIPFSLEQILAQNPDYVLRFAHGNLEETKKAFDQAFDKNPAYKELDAVKNGNVIDLDPMIFNVSANIKVTDAIKTLGQVFYGK